MAPYVLAILEMEEGCHLTSQIINADHTTVEAEMQVDAALQKLVSEGEAGVVSFQSPGEKANRAGAALFVPNV